MFDDKWRFWEMSKVQGKLYRIFSKKGSLVFVPDFSQVSNTHRVRLGFQSRIWVGFCQYYVYIKKKKYTPSP